ncbi:MAG: Hpt domain-containing protein [Anaerolineales bacterium]|nr:MAG: Hpt domain-containing protein [Anaerolineales bacterium]
MTVIDLNTFNTLRESTGGDFIMELIDTLIEDLPSQVAQLKDALAAQDADSFRRAAHTLKSNAATFGAYRLTDLARELETMGRENNLDTGNRLQVLEEAVTDVIQHLKELK